MKEIAILLAALLVLVTLVTFVYTAPARIRCHTRWADAGVKVDYSITSGCRLSEDDGKTWIPSDHWRRGLP